MCNSLGDICARLTPSHVINGIESLPSADRPTGEWIKSHIGTIAEGYFCTNCGKHGYREYLCPNCGAKMKGADDEEST